MASIKQRVWFHRTCALIWLALLIPAYHWWRESILFVIAASVYANIKSDWAASEAADDRNVLEALARIESLLTQLVEVRQEEADNS